MKSKSIDRMEGRTSRLRSPTEHGVDRAGEGTPGLAKGQFVFRGTEDRKFRNF